MRGLVRSQGNGDMAAATDFVGTEHLLRVRARNGDIIAITNIWFARDFLRESVVPTPVTEELLRQIDNPLDEQSARFILKAFEAWAKDTGILVRSESKE